MEPGERPLVVWAVDDHPVVLRGLVALLADVDGGVVAGQCASDLAALDMTKPAPDAVLLDVHLADGSRAEDNVRTLADQGFRVLLFTAEDRPVPLRNLMNAGALGLALKSDSAADLLDAVRAVADGKVATTSHLAHALLTDQELAATLAPRELDVLEALNAGVPKKAIGRAVPGSLSANTVDTYFQRIALRYARLGRPVSNIYGSLREATKDGYFDVR